jgi:hypothetical protein
MDKKTVFVKTQVGETTMSSMSGDMRRVMLLIDDKSSYEEVSKRAPPSLRGDLPEIMQRLLDSELIRDRSKAVVAPKIVVPKVVPPPYTPPKNIDEFDFTSLVVPPSEAVMAAEAAKQQAQLEADLKQKHEAETARLKAEQEFVRLKLEQESIRIKAEAEARAKQEAEAARIKAEQEVARIKAEQEAVRIKAEAEARAKQEAEAVRIKAEQEAARIKAEQEAVRIKAEAEARAKQEAEAARIKAEQEAAQIKADAEARAKQALEVARIKAEQEAEKIKAEAEALRIKVAQEAIEIKVAAEALRIKAEQEAERIKLEAEEAKINAAKAAANAIAKAESDAAKVRAEIEANALAELRAKQEAETAQVKAAQEEARIKAAQVAIALEKAEAVERAKLKATQDEATRVASQMAAEEKAKIEIQSAKQAALAAASITPAASSGFKIDLAPLQSVAVDVMPETNSKASHDDVKLIAAKAEEQRVAEIRRLEAEKLQQEAELARQKVEEEEARKKDVETAKAKAAESALATEQADAWAEAEQRAKLQSGLEAAQVKQQAATQKKSISPAHRARRKPLPIGKVLFAMVGLIFAALFILPLIYPLQEYIAPIEKRLSTQLKQPVKVAGISASLLPLPKIELKGISIGAGEEIKVSEIVLSFDALTLLSENKAINDATLSNVVLDGKRLEQLVDWLSLTAKDIQYPVRHVTLRSVTVNAEGVTLPALKGSADIVQGAYTRVVLHSEDDKMSVELVPVENRWQLTLGVKERALPLLPEVVFSDFNAKGMVGDGEINFSQVDAHIYGGILAGSGKINWRKGWQVQGRMQAKTMELEKMFPQLGLAGEVFAGGAYTMQSVKLPQLGDAPRLDGSFAAKRGVINGVDVVETARLTSRDHLPGGRTHFDEMTGSVQLENHNKHFRQIKITSGMLTASGSFDISSKDQLSGNLNAQIKMREGNNALTLSGTIAQPKLVAQ